MSKIECGLAPTCKYYGSGLCINCPFPYGKKPDKKGKNNGRKQN